MELPSSMLVARYYNNHDVRVEQASIPDVLEGEALLRVDASGICGSDVLEWFRLPKSPRILGHEVAGTVVHSRSENLSVGERVAIRNQVSCGTCSACQSGYVNVCERGEEISPGGMAEFVKLPHAVIRRACWSIPDELSTAAAALSEPIACVLHSQRMAEVRRRRCAVVLGCGVFGLLHIQLARHAGVKSIVAVEPHAGRRALAKRLGADVAVEHPEELPGAIRALNHGALADLVLVCTGDPSAQASAFASAGRYGALLFFAVPPPGQRMPMGLNELLWRKELSVLSSYGAGSVPFALPLQLMVEGVVEHELLLTHRLPLAEAAAGFSLVCKGGDTLKVVLTAAAP